MEIGRKLKIRKYGRIVMVMGESSGTCTPIMIFFLALREQEGEVSAIRRAHAHVRAVGRRPT